MRISQVEFRQLVSFGEYENMSVGATATVGFDELPETVLANLRTWVCGQLADHKSMAEKERMANYAKAADESEIRRFNDLVTQARERWEKAKAFLELHGLEAPNELPF